MDEQGENTTHTWSMSADRDDFNDFKMEPSRSFQKAIDHGIDVDVNVNPKALGGPVYSGKIYTVGERGPELFFPEVAISKPRNLP